MKIMSMGWGVQTWTMAAMMALDELPRADYLIFADTHHEGSATYAFERQWKPWLVEHGLALVTVEAENTNLVREDWSGSIQIPAYTVSATGSEGQVRRQCTNLWKIAPIRRWVRGELERIGVPLSPGVVEMQMGISWDEALRRVKDSDVRYITHTYPLVDRRITRMGCIEWLQSHGLPVAPKSA
jgi:3'-phosphoadenosine 5'-phosphosulfate sulfotransferase (PAPS reductase)/FAD synthetase